MHSRFLLGNKRCQLRTWVFNVDVSCSGLSKIYICVQKNEELHILLTTSKIEDNLIDKISQISYTSPRE